LFYSTFKDIYTLEKDIFADLAHFQHSVLEMGQVFVLELISPVFKSLTIAIVALEKKIAVYK